MSTNEAAPSPSADLEPASPASEPPAEAPVETPEKAPRKRTTRASTAKTSAAKAPEPEASDTGDGAAPPAPVAKAAASKTPGTRSTTTRRSASTAGRSKVAAEPAPTQAPTGESADAAAPPEAPAARSAAPGQKASKAPVEQTPAATSEEVQPESSRTSERTPAPSSGRRVVVAEDEALIRLDVVETLREAGFDVVGEAGDGETAVQLATSLRPDVVVMDIKMPILDGISAAERIGKARIAPVVLLTAFSQAELVERARDAGAMAYVVKPFTPAELLPAIEIAIARHQQITALEAEVADLAERFETRKRVDRAKGLLMTKMGLTEPESFRWIQKTSMDRRLTMREVADAVIEQVGQGERTR